MLKALIRSTPRLSKLINGLAYEPNLYLFQLEGNRLGFAFLCSPLSGSSGDEADRLKAGLTVDWPEKTTIQFSLICTENINEMKTGFLRLRRAFRESGRTDLPVETQALLEKVTNARAEYFSDRTMRPVDSISGVRIRTEPGRIRNNSDRQCVAYPDRSERGEGAFRRTANLAGQLQPGSRAAHQRFLP